MKRTAFLLLMFAIGSILGASCNQQRHAASPSAVDSGAPVCTSTVSCPFPPPRHP